MQLMFLFTSLKPGLKLRVTAENITQTSSVSEMRLKTRRSSIYYKVLMVTLFGLDCTEPGLGQIRATLHLLTGAHGIQILLDSALQCHLVTLGPGLMKTAILHFLSFATLVSTVDLISRSHQDKDHSNHSNSMRIGKFTE